MAGRPLLRVVCFRGWQACMVIGNRPGFGDGSKRQPQDHDNRDKERRHIPHQTANRRAKGKVRRCRKQAHDVRSVSPGFPPACDHRPLPHARYRARCNRSTIFARSCVCHWYHEPGSTATKDIARGCQADWPDLRPAQTQAIRDCVSAWTGSEPSLD